MTAPTPSFAAGQSGNTPEHSRRLCAIVTAGRTWYMSGVRRALGALLLALGRDPGVTLIETDRWTLAEEL
jgi:hypothetical protein